MAWQDSHADVADCGGSAQSEQEIAEFRNHQQLSRELVEVSEPICRLPPRRL